MNVIMLGYLLVRQTAYPRRADLDFSAVSVDDASCMIYPPKVALSALVASLKGVVEQIASAAVRGLSSVAEAAWCTLVSVYFAASCGGAPLDILRQYIEQQQAPH